MHDCSKAAIALGLSALLAACGGQDAPQAKLSANESVVQASQSGANVPAIFSAEVAMAPADKEEISGVVRLEVRGAQMANVELLPENGYTPKLGVFKVSEDGSMAWLDLDTTKLSNGPVAVRVSAFNVPAGQPGAQEIVAMPVRSWNVNNSDSHASSPFSAALTSAPVDGATVRGITRLKIRGSGIANAELLPATGYSPRLGVFNVSADKTYAWLDFDTRALPDGMRAVRISAFNVTEGQAGAQEIIAMPARSWNFGNGATQAFTAAVTMAPPHGAMLNGTARLEVRGSGLENVELLPAYGYEPKLGSFTISSDKTYAYLDVDTDDLPAGTYARISAFNAPAGSATAREIIAMPARQWQTPAEGSPPSGPLTNIQFTAPDSIAADASGNIYVVDGEEGQNRIRRIAPNGQATTLLQLDRPFTRIHDLEVTPTGDIYYILKEGADAQYSSIDSAIWKIVNGAPAQRVASANGMSLAVDSSNGDIYVQDSGEMKRIRQNGAMETLFSLNDGLATALTLHQGALWFHFDVAALGRTSHIVSWTPEGGWVGGSDFRDESDGPLRGVDMVSTDSGVYIIRGFYSRPDDVTLGCRVELFSTNTEESTFVAGGESCGYQDGTGRAALLNGGSLTQATDGNLYLSDRENNVIRRITPSGQVSLFAGTPSQ